MSPDFYQNTSEDTQYMLDKMQRYVRLCLELGDAVHTEHGNKLVIQILRAKKMPPEPIKKNQLTISDEKAEDLATRQRGYAMVKEFEDGLKKKGDT